MTESTFLPAVRSVIELEGGLSMDAQDPGGATKFGVSKRFAGSIHLDLDGDGKTTERDIQLVTLKKAQEIYFDHFWKPTRAGDLPAGVAFALLDFAVHCGVPAAARRLQRAVKTAEDGVIGSKTIAATRKFDVPETLTNLTAYRCKKYCNTNNSDIYGTGWMRRAIIVHQRSIAYHLYQYSL